MKKFTKKIYHEEFNYEHDDGTKLPIVYSSQYSVKFCGLQKLHPFDAAKGHHIMQTLKSHFITDGKYHKPSEITENELLKVHTKEYIQSLRWSLNAAKIAEIPLLFFVPNSIVQRGYLRPMRFQTAGSILAGKLALHEGWAINLGGGFHHCCSYKGGGFCPYADITLLIKRIQSEEKEYNITKIMIIDLDAHQGNGHERDFMNDSQIYILDMYNASIYPKDHHAKLAIKCAVELPIRTKDSYYLKKLKQSLTKALNDCTPDLIVYNAGTDVLENDPLGLLSITPSGVIQRDEMVFHTAITKKIPIVMLLSGGYLRSSAKVIADSIMNLKAKGLLTTKM